MVEPTLVVRGTIVRLKCELASGEFIALAEVTSRHDKRGVINALPHPTFKNYS